MRREGHRRHTVPLWADTFREIDLQRREEDSSESDTFHLLVLKTRILLGFQKV